jgi:hypothetical protein
MSYQSEEDQAAEPGASVGEWAIMCAVALAAAVLAAAAWGALRAYTDIWNVRNLRVFVAVFLLIIPMIAAPVAAYACTGLRQMFLIVMPFIAMTPIVGGEWLGSMWSGQPMVWESFNMIWLGMSLVLTLIACGAAVLKE